MHTPASFLDQVVWMMQASLLAMCALIWCGIVVTTLWLAYDSFRARTDLAQAERLREAILQGHQNGQPR